MRVKAFFMLVSVLFLGLDQIDSAELEHRAEFFLKDLIFSTSGGFDQIYLQGGEITQEVGKPQLPFELFQVTLPPGSEVEEVVVTSSEGDFLPEKYTIFPAQPPRILSLGQEPIPFIEPESGVYQQNTEYPGKLVEYRGTGYLGGYQLANILVYPLQYIPAAGRVKFYSQIEFKIIYAEGKRKPLPLKRRSASGTRVYEDILKKTASKSAGATARLETQKVTKSLLPPGDYEYVIVAQRSFESVFQPLADWKTQKGTPTKIVATDWIYSNYSGYDSAEKLRNFIKDAYQSWGTLWVLLGGDTNRIPLRLVWAMDCEAGMDPDENDIPCDLYFSDLDGTWDANGNHIYGEVEDSVDIYPDVFVGRASCSSVTQAQALVDKILTYEKNPPTDYQTRMLFLAEILWNDPYTNSGLAKDLIDGEYVPPQFDPITKLYEALGNENISSVLAAMNQGQNIINHDGHCWHSVMGVGGDYLSLSDMDDLSNGPRNSILFSIGCWPAAIEYDCIAERFINNPDGGGVAFIGNSRYGWGSPGNPEYGYSDRFDQQFFAALFSRDVYKIGAAVADMKSFYVPLSQQENVYRWCMYQINLLGDPEMSIWTDIPQILWVQHPDTVRLGSGEFTVTVCRDSAASVPLPEALVCIMKGEEIYQRGLADQQGQVRFEISPSTSGEMYVTVTAHNFFFYTDTVIVHSAGANLAYQEHSLDDYSGGNDDGQLSPGESVQMYVSIINWGQETAYDVIGVLHSKENPYLNLIDSLGNFGDIDPGETASNLLPYSFSLDSSCPNNHILYFELELLDTSGVSGKSIIPLTVVTPHLAYYSYLIDDASQGNGNGKAEPGESFNLRVYVKNQGQSLAKEVSGYLSTSCAYVDILDSIVSFGDIDSEETKNKVYPVSVNPSCPSSYFPYLCLRTGTSDGYSYEDSFVLSIGEMGFEDDMEQGEGQWTHAGSGDMWHLSTHRKYSGERSWYNGIESSWHFNNNMACWLKSSSFTLGPNSQLSFWLWYDVANYGVDGIYVEVADELAGIYDTLDFIGSGGALDSLTNTGNDWLEYKYDLSHLPAGTNCYVRFSFISDDQYTSEGEGFYLDDVRIEKEIFPWIYGDINCDMAINISDVVLLINYLFKGGPEPVPELLAGDANCDGQVTISDVIHLINYLFKSGPPPGC